MASSAQMEKRTASNCYFWLWLSPLLTVPSLVVLELLAYISVFPLICGGNSSGCDEAAVQRTAILIAVLGSALWHLILLYPALAAKSEFVRWHGRQALLLAGVRTAIPLVCGLGGAGGVCLAVLALIPIYVWGNLWGQRQATRGDCSLMRRFGRAGALPPPEPAVVPEKAREVVAEALVGIIRYSQDPEERRGALSHLEKLGLVEPL